MKFVTIFILLIFSYLISNDVINAKQSKFEFQSIFNGIMSSFTKGDVRSIENEMNSSKCITQDAFLTTVNK